MRQKPATPDKSVRLEPMLPPFLSTLSPKRRGPDSDHRNCASSRSNSIVPVSILPGTLSLLLSLLAAATSHGVIHAHGSVLLFIAYDRLSYFCQASARFLSIIPAIATRPS